MEKSQKIVIALIICFIAVTLIGANIYTNNKKYKIISEIADNVLASSENVMLYIGSSNCSVCDMQAEEMAQLLKKKSFSYYYIDIEEVRSDARKEELFDKLKLNDREAIYFPSMFVYKDGNLVDALENSSGLGEIYNFIKKNNIVDGDFLNINFMNYDEYLNKMNENSQNIIAFTSYRMNEGISFQSKIIELQDEYGFDINILYLDDLNEEQYNSVKNSFDFFDDDIYVPTLFVMNKGNLIDYTNSSEKEDYVDFFKKLNIIYE